MPDQQLRGLSEIDGGAIGLVNLGTITIAGAGERRLSHALNNSGTIIHGGSASLVPLEIDVLTNLLLNSLTNTADLAFDAFDAASFPSSAISGQNVTLTYRVKNPSDLPAEGIWIDSVYLSADGTLDPADALLARVEHQGGVAGVGNYSATVTAVLPPMANGAYRVIVLVDSRGLASDADRGNNTGVSGQAIAVTVPSLVLGVPIVGSIAPAQDLYYRVLVPPGEDVTVGADFAALPGAELAIRYGTLPDRTKFDDAAQPGQLNPRLLVANTQGGIYYLHLRGREDAAASVAFTFKADASGFEVTRVSPLKGCNRGLPAVLELHGSQFTTQTQIHLHMVGGESRAAQSVLFVNANRIVAMVDLTDLPTGNYQVVADDAGKTALAFDAFTVTSNPRRIPSTGKAKRRAYVPARTPPTPGTSSGRTCDPNLV